MSGLSAEIANIIENVAKTEGFQHYEIQIGEGNKKGEGFLGEILFVTLLEENSEKRLDLVVKKALSNESVRSEHPIRECFINESLFYETIYPTLLKFQKEHNIKKCFTHVPKYYSSSLKNENECLVLQNVKHLGYELFDKKKDIPLDHFVMIFKTYGRLHATSYALKELNPQKYLEFKNAALNVNDMFINNEMFAKATDEICRAVGEKFIPGQDDDIIKVFKPIAEHGADVFRDVGTYKGKFDTLLHGDCWSNNMMFKYDDTRKLEDVMVIDWQLIRTGSPVYDLSYCLYSGASKETLDRLNDLLQNYYDSLSENLLSFGLNPDKIYSISVFKEEWKELSIFGMIFGFMLWKMKLTKQEDVVDFADFSNKECRDAVGEKYFNASCEELEKICRDIVLHIIEIGAL